MIKSIRYMSIGAASKIVEEKTENDRIAVISIRDEDTPWNFPYHKLGSGNYLKLEFHDIDKQVEPPFDPMILFDRSMAMHIILFVDVISAREEEYDLIIHCSAGISRSAAVYMQVASKLGFPYDDKYPLYNKLVYRILENVYNEIESNILDRQSHDNTHGAEIETKEKPQV